MCTSRHHIEEWQWSLEIFGRWCEADQAFARRLWHESQFGQKMSLSTPVLVSDPGGK